MILERTSKEILVRLPAYVDISELQDMLDYLEYKEVTSKSKAMQNDVEDLSNSANKNMWQTFKNKRNLK